MTDIGIHTSGESQIRFERKLKDKVSRQRTPLLTREE